MSDSNAETESEPAVRLELYADYVCPFCYLGRRSLERYRDTSERLLVIDWQPFDLRRGKRNPDGSIDNDADDGKDDAYFEQARRNVRRLQDRYDVEMAQELATGVDSLVTQRASWYVKREFPERWAAFDESIYEALWQDGRDIGDVSVVTELAEGAGLPDAEIRSAIESQPLQEDLEARFADARRRGITGVPTFVVDGTAARGAVSPDRLERLIEDRASTAGW
ncbi:DsbA family oxidoreductase [Halopiger djelfimassiliensis]|uniref:DsbA family oxidoreductase n=1 Tax=Halopiger djelfimassiliensis TaxID=1293047 RepID=UPI000677A297|nr:DsbA family protein [Halopiger djelfimassiliensis]